MIDDISFDQMMDGLSESDSDLEDDLLVYRDKDGKPKVNVLNSNVDGIDNLREKMGLKFCGAKSSENIRDCHHFDRVEVEEIESFGQSSNLCVSYPVSDGMIFKNIVPDVIDRDIIKKDRMNNQMIGRTRNVVNRSRPISTKISIDKEMSIREFLLKPLPKDGTKLQCRLIRDREGLNRLAPVYRLWIDKNNSHILPSNVENKIEGLFLMAAKKKVVKSTPYFLIGMEMEPSDRGSALVIGKVRGNAIGSQYIILDNGIAPDKTSAPSVTRREQGLIKFEYLESGPSHINCFIPDITNTSLEGQEIAYHSDEGENMIEAVKKEDYKGMLRLTNILPKWDAVHGGHVLNFHGRVTESSVKNFQLKLVGRYGSNPEVSEAVDHTNVVLQFGRVGKNEFTMDLQWPLSPFQAFSICTSSIDGKIADRRGYAIMKKLIGSGS